MKDMYVYIMTNQHNTTLYIGVTNNLVRRIWEHKNKIHKGFTAKYNLNKLVYYELCDNELAAIAREKQLKLLRKQKKIDLVCGFNPNWVDLYDSLI